MFGYFRRVKNSFGAMVVGLLMVPGAILLHGWNEYRTVHRTRGLAEAARIVESIPDVNKVSEELNEKLVHLTGTAETDDILADTEFFVSENAIRLARRVEMYQWEEKKETSRGDSDKPPRYSYAKEWNDSRIDSSQFHDANGHVNPPMAYQSEIQTAAHVHVGAYELNESLKNSMNDWSAIDIPKEAILENLAEEKRENYVFDSGRLYIGQEKPTPSQPEVGDLRIWFEVVRPAAVSIVAQLKGDTFATYRTSNGEQIERLYMGTLSSAEVMERLVTENTVIAWVLRLVGLVLSVIGFAMILRPLSAFASFVPFLGELTGGIMFVVAVLLGVIVSLTTISIAWIAVRPLLGISLLVVVALACFAIYRIRKRHPPQVIDSSMLVG